MTALDGPAKKTRLVFLEDTYRTKLQAVILDIGAADEKAYFILDETIFHPQGGGQPADQGWLQLGTAEIPISAAQIEKRQVKHFVSREWLPSLAVGMEVQLVINPGARLQHARLHSAGHLITNIVEAHCPDLSALKGYHFCDNPYVEFKDKSGTGEWGDLERLSILLQQHILENVEIKVDLGTEYPSGCGANLTANIPQQRTVKVHGFPALPCGGTHVHRTLELAGITVAKIKKVKKDILRVGYNSSQMAL